MNRAIEWLLGVDPGELAGANNWWIDFVADWNSYARLTLLVVLGGLVYLVVRSYRREGDAPRRVKVALAAIRLAVVLLIFGVLFQPAIMLRFVKTLHRSLVVLVDDSLSMSFKDRYADEAQRRELAEFLQVDADALGGLSRAEIARRALTRESGPVPALATDHPLMVMRYSTDRPGQDPYTRLVETLEPAAGNDGGTQAASGRLAEILAGLKGMGYETNIGAALRDALERTQGRRVAGIVLVSDGRNTVRGVNELTGVLLYARQRGVPVYTVAVGDPTPPKNLAVTGVQAPSEVRRKARAEFNVLLSHRNLVGQSVRIRLLQRAVESADWKETGVAETVKLTAPAEGAADPSGRGSQTVTLYYEPEEVGQFVFQAVADVRPDEQNSNDNSAQALVKVSDEKINILLVSGDAGYEFQYLKNILYRSPELYRLSVWQQNADKAVNQAASTGMKLTRLPQTLEELIGSPDGKTSPGYDVILLYDPQPTVDGFDEKFVDMLKTFVRSHGGGLCYLAGNKYSEAALPAEGPYAALVDLLPVTLAPNRINLTERIGGDAPEPWQAKLTSYGLDHPVMRLGDTSEQTQQVWDMLPGIYWSHPVFKAKPAARVLAVHSNPLHLTSRREPEPLIAVQPVGGGKVLYVGFDETWRWRFVQDAYYHRRFWANVVRYLASLKAHKIIITTGGDRFSVGEKIRIEVEAYDDQYRPITDEVFEVEMKNVAAGTSETIPLKAADTENRPGQYVGTVVAARTGAFELSPRRALETAERADAVKRIVIDLPQAESQRTEADWTGMAAIASRPEYALTAGQVDRLVELVPPGRLTMYQDVPRELWDSRLALLLIVALLVTEWILRKKYNMA